MTYSEDERTAGFSLFRLPDSITIVSCPLLGLKFFQLCYTRRVDVLSVYAWQYFRNYPKQRAGLLFLLDASTISRLPSQDICTIPPPPTTSIFPLHSHFLHHNVGVVCVLIHAYDQCENCGPAEHAPQIRAIRSYG